MNSLLKKPRLSVLIAKNALRSDYRHHPNEVKMDDLYNNIIHSAMESALCAYLAKKRNKALKREFGAHEMDINHLQEKCTKLKARVTEVENTMKETLEFIDKLQTDLDLANAANATIENRAKTIEN